MKGNSVFEKMETGRRGRKADKGKKRERWKKKKNKKKRRTYSRPLRTHLPRIRKKKKKWFGGQSWLLLFGLFFSLALYFFFPFLKLLINFQFKK